MKAKKRESRKHVKKDFLYVKGKKTEVKKSQLAESSKDSQSKKTDESKTKGK